MSTLIKNTLVVDRLSGTQRFKVSAGNGERVEFPITFASDKVDVFIPGYFDGADFIHAGTTAQAVTDRSGFTLSKIGIPGNGNKPYWDDRKSPVTVIAYGEFEPEDLSDDDDDIKIALL